MTIMRAQVESSAGRLWPITGTPAGFGAPMMDRPAMEVTLKGKLIKSIQEVFEAVYRQPEMDGLTFHDLKHAASITGGCRGVTTFV
jgi:hypothetical protein